MHKEDSGYIRYELPNYMGGSDGNIILPAGVHPPDGVLQGIPIQFGEPIPGIDIGREEPVIGMFVSDKAFKDDPYAYGRNIAIGTNGLIVPIYVVSPHERI